MIDSHKKLYSETTSCKGQPSTHAPQAYRLIGVHIPETNVQHALKANGLFGSLRYPGISFEDFARVWCVRRPSLPAAGPSIYKYIDLDLDR